MRAAPNRPLTRCHVAAMTSVRASRPQQPALSLVRVPRQVLRRAATPLAPRQVTLAGPAGAGGRSCPPLRPMAAWTRDPECLTFKAILAIKPDITGGRGMFAGKSPVLGAFALAMLASTCAQAQVSDDVVKIGVLTDMNGPA